MKLSFIMAKNNLRKWLMLAVMLVVVNTGSAVFAQDDQDNDPAAVEPPASTGGAVSSGTLSSGPWGGNTTTARPERNNTSAGTAARPVGGSTVLDLPDGPPNPDVPFDSNMNLAFLVVGIVFAYVVYRKRFAVKNEPLTK